MNDGRWPIEQILDLSQTDLVEGARGEAVAQHLHPCALLAQRSSKVVGLHAAEAAVINHQAVGEIAVAQGELARHQLFQPFRHASSDVPGGPRPDRVGRLHLQLHTRPHSCRERGALDVFALGRSGLRA